MSDLVDFLLARIAEDEADARMANGAPPPRHWSAPTRVLAECEAKRRIVELHRDWPVLVERPTEFEPSFGADPPFVDQVTYRASKQIAWMTEQEYRNRFGDEPPTAPMLAAMAVVYADHPDYREEWRP